MTATTAIRSLRRTLHDRRGETTVQYAFVLPIFLAIVYGIIELGRVLFTVYAMHHAAADGARFAVVRGAQSAAPATVSQIETAVRDGAIVDQSHMQVTVQEIAEDGTVTTASADRIFEPGQNVRILTAYQFDFILPVFPRDSVDISQFADMVIMH